MATQFAPSEEIRRIRDRIDHPIVDGDGHVLEVTPLVVDFVREVAGADVTRAFVEFLRGAVDPHRAGFARARVFWGLPEENTLDRMTATLPRLLYERSDELGLDYLLLYPSLGLTILALPHEEIRRAAARALNTYYASTFEGFRDRLEPVAVIPTFSPEEAVAELDHAIGTLGLKTVVMSAVIPRPPRADGSRDARLDTLGHDSDYDYDPVWRRCVELGVVPAFHGVGYGWGTRFSPTNYVYNHLGNFGVAQEAACRSLLMGGVPRRFPDLRFSFLEGGVSWGAQLLADVLGHFEKRNRDAVGACDPRRFDLALCGELFEAFATGRIAQVRDAYEAAARSMQNTTMPAGLGFDDFAESLIESEKDVVDVFTRQFHFGCEADDPLNALAFTPDLLPHGARLNAVFASDIGHWDVADMREVVPEAWEMVERGRIGEQDFCDFTFANVTRMLTAGRPDFFEGTAIADAVRRAAVG
jgi:hypothetical protein